MDIKEMRAASAADRANELEALQKQQFALRMQRATGQLANHAQMKQVRRQIARLKTVMQEAAKGAAGK